MKRKKISQMIVFFLAIHETNSSYAIPKNNFCADSVDLIMISYHDVDIVVVGWWIFFFFFF
jgi:hypothetical protein